MTAKLLSWIGNPKILTNRNKHIAHRVLKVNEEDNVFIALANIPKGGKFIYKEKEYLASEMIPAKHKVCQEDLPEGSLIKMYGVIVGQTTRAIAKGSLITTDNIRHTTGEYEISSKTYEWEPPDLTRFQGRTFNGYHRHNGTVGTMNYWLVIPLVFCENRNVAVIKDAMSAQLGYMTNQDFQVDTAKLIAAYQNGAASEELLETDIILDKNEVKATRIFQNVDGIRFLAHEGGCGGTRQDSDLLCRLLAGYINHPNVAGATVLSLGCQNAQIALMKSHLEVVDPNRTKPVYFLEQQQSISERDYIADAVKKTFVGLIEANKCSRQPAPLSKLVLGLECGGSDGFSGITANPSLGYTSDLLVGLGGSALLAEFPELNGVEQELINRCSSLDAAEKFAELMSTYAARAEKDGSGFAFNPSPGNIKDGLITDAIKSAGAAKKGGSSPVEDVLDYGEPVNKAGLSLLCTPGNDVESTTGLAGSGANVIVFTTGLGTPTGNPVAPTIKMSTNSKLARKMSDIIDIDAGTILSGEDTIETKGEELLEYIIQVASGELVPKAVLLGQEDFIPWKRGISL